MYREGQTWGAGGSGLRAALRRGALLAQGLILVVALLLALVVPTEFARAAPVIHVRFDGDDTLCNGEYDAPASSAPNCAKETIQAGIDVVDPSGTVYVSAGTFNENINIGKDVTIQGSGANWTIIDGGGLSITVAINSGRTVEISHLTVQNGDWLWGGGIVLPESSQLTLSDCIVRDNTASGSGGGIHAPGTITIQRCTIEGNTSEALAGAAGGGIYLGHNDATIVDTTIRDNHADNGSVEGGGVYANVYSGATLTMKRVTIEGNTASNWGAGINISGQPSGTGSIYMGNVTITGNVSGAGPAGIFFAPVDTLTTLNNSVVAGNQIGSGTVGGISAYAPVLLANTIVAANDGDQCYNGIGTGWVSNGYNIDSGTTCGFTSAFDQSNTDPLLGTLQDNGGYVETLALLPGSPAIDTGDGATCYNMPVDGVDARGVARPIGTFCDIGPYEAPIWLFLPLIQR
jgi:predicted outer membrane repeat protein